MRVKEAGRSISGFTFSPGSVGGPLCGAVDPRLAAFAARSARADFSLPAAVAASGSGLGPGPNEEKGRALALLMNLANVRLGCWLPNPRSIEHGLRNLRFSRRRPRPHYLIKYLLGTDTIDDDYLYVTDGAYYENLGLVELLRRGCTEIYCFDASRGASFDALGKAIALARVELGVEITIDLSELAPDLETGQARTPAVIGDVRFRSGERGTLIYARTAVTRQAPADVQLLNVEDAAFPHYSSYEQMLDDRYFEAYRMLGSIAAEHTVAAAEARARGLLDPGSPLD
jgi:hypothetical protein